MHFILQISTLGLTWVASKLLEKADESKPADMKYANYVLIMFIVVSVVALALSLPIKEKLVRYELEK